MLDCQLSRACANANAAVRVVFDEVPIPAFAKDAHGRYFYVNDAFCQLTGKSKSDYIGKDVFEVHPKDLATVLYKMDAALFANGGSQVYPVQAQRKDGSRIHTLLQKSCLHDVTGRVTAIVGILTDVTELRETQEKLIESKTRLEKNEARLKDFTAASSDCLWETGPDLRFTWISESVFNICGFPPENFLGKTHAETTLEDISTPKWQGHLEDLEARRPFRDFCTTVRSQSGAGIHLSLSGQPIFDADGLFRGYRGTGRDITENVIANHNTHQAQARLRDAVESLADGFVLFDAEGRLVMCNENYRRAYGPIADILVPGIQYEDILRTATANGRVADIEGCEEEWIEERLKHWNNPQSRVEFRNDEDRWIEVLQYKTSDGGRVVIRSDVTDRKLAEIELLDVKQRLHNTQKLDALGTLAGGIAHDFNNVLQPILGLASLTAKRLPDGSQEQQNLKEIVSAAKHGGSLVTRILRFARAEQSNAQVIRPSEVISESLSMLRSTIPSRISLVLNLKDNIEAALIDPAQLHQVVNNLCVNAIHAMEETGGKLAVSTECDNPNEGDSQMIAAEPGRLRLTVSDTGSGMPPEVIQRLFEPFFTTKDVGRGTGVGLSVVHGIVAAVGGTVYVESEPGKGSTFTIIWPFQKSGQPFDLAHTEKTV